MDINVKIIDLNSQYNKYHRQKVRKLRKNIKMLNTFIIILCFVLIACLAQVNKIQKEKISTNLVTKVSAAEIQEYKKDIDTDLKEYSKKYNESELISYSIPESNTGKKTYMDYRAITDKKSNQWALQQSSYTNDEGFRMSQGSYLIAVGSYYSTTIGETMLVTFENGMQIKTIIGDLKQDVHTDSLNQHANGNVIEFIVDSSIINSDSKIMGDMSFSGFKGRITAIEKVV